MVETRYVQVAGAAVALVGVATAVVLAVIWRGLPLNEMGLGAVGITIIMAGPGLRRRSIECVRSLTEVVSKR